MKPTEPICILVKIFRSVPWTQERIWHRFPCINPGKPDPEFPAADGKNVNWEYVSQIINLTQTTSASYLLMSSLDISRRNLALRERNPSAKVSRDGRVCKRRDQCHRWIYAYGKDMINGSSVYDFDVTKLSVYTQRYRSGGYRSL